MAEQGHWETHTQDLQEERLFSQGYKNTFNDHITV